jgi:Glyoxalase-like domain
MSSKIDIIHHAGLISEDLGGVVAQYERLGFTFTPLSHVRITISPGADPVYIGLGNRNAIFERNYLEVVGIPDPDIWAKFPLEKRGPFNIDERLKRYRGLHIMHFGTEDIEGVRAQYIAEAQPISEVARLQRMVDTPDGERLMQARCIFYPPTANPEGLIQVAQHVTPQYALQPRYMNHLNCAKRLSEVIVCSDAPEQSAAKYSRYSGHAVTRHGDLHIVDLGHTRIVTVDPTGLEKLVPGYLLHPMPFLAGFTISTADIARARAHLSEQGVPFADVNGRLVVSPDNGYGSAVLFETLDATR